MNEIIAPPSVLVSQSESGVVIQTPPAQTYSSPQTIKDRLALPEKLSELPEWLRTPIGRHLRLKQRNWPAKTVQQSTWQLFNRLSKVIDFFIQNSGWNSWEQVSTRWLEDYIDAKLRENLAPTTINWDLIAFRVLCVFLLDEGYNISKSITKMNLLDEPRRFLDPSLMTRYADWKVIFSRREARPKRICRRS